MRSNPEEFTLRAEEKQWRWEWKASISRFPDDEGIDNDQHDEDVSRTNFLLELGSSRTK
jgi:hypothetical protein